MNNAPHKTYLGLGDSMSIDLYTDVIGGGAVSQFYRSLGPGWTLENHTSEGCVIAGVPRDKTGDLITLTIGGNNLLIQQGKFLAEGLGDFGNFPRRRSKDGLRSSSQATAHGPPETPL